MLDAEPVSALARPGGWARGNVDHPAGPYHRVEQRAAYFVFQSGSGVSLTSLSSDSVGASLYVDYSDRRALRQRSIPSNDVDRTFKTFEANDFLRGVKATPLLAINSDTLERRRTGMAETQ
jgi:hypothetical protein